MSPAATVMFYALAAITLGAALGVVLSRSLFHSAMYLVLAFFGLAGLYITLQADFVAAVQVLIYAGAIAVLLIFGILLTPDVQRRSVMNRQAIPGAIVALLVLVVLGYGVFNTAWPVLALPPIEPTTRGIADLLFNAYVLPFELASVLLLAAMIGAIVLAQED